MDIEGAVQKARSAFESGKTKSLTFRKQQLKALHSMISDNEQEVYKALEEDLRKCRIETYLTEMKIITLEIEEYISNLDEWCAPARPKKSLSTLLDDLYIIKEPYGVVLIIGSWNYPLLLLLSPVMGAIAAGNCVVIKPSEQAVATERFLKKYLPQYLDQECFPLVCGGIPETTQLLTNKFDYIFFTGGTNIGKIVHTAAAKHLTPTTLELGGKSPVYIHDSSDVKLAVRRLLWGKFMNVGQTCIAPDYVLCSQEVERQALQCIPEIFEEFYGKDPKQSPDLGRIINERQFKRLAAIIQKSQVAIGGVMDSSELYISPTIVTGCTKDSAAMQEEIFGPILPFVTVSNHREAIDFINAHEKPLSLYLFSKDQTVIWEILDKTSSGGVTVNDTILHFTVDSFPFGGVGSSGMGRYHGKYTFDTFTHEKPCLYKSFNAIGEALASCRYPPYSETKKKILAFLLFQKRRKGFKYISQVLAFAFGLLTSYCYYNNLIPFLR